MGICYHHAENNENYSNVRHSPNNLNSFVLDEDFQVPSEFVFVLKGYSTAQLALRSGNKSSIQKTVIETHIKQIQECLGLIESMQSLKPRIHFQLLKVDFFRLQKESELTFSINLNGNKEQLSGKINQETWKPNQMKCFEFQVEEPIQNPFINIEWGSCHSSISVERKKDESPVLKTQFSNIHQGSLIEPIGMMYWRLEIIKNFAEDKKNVRNFLLHRKKQLQKMLNKQQNLEDSFEFGASSIHSITEENDKNQ